MNDNLYENKFLHEDYNRDWIVPFISAPPISLHPDSEMPELDLTSKRRYLELYKKLSRSELNKGGAAIIFGTFDNFHIGHRIMVGTANAVCNDLYVGIEDTEVAMMRKAHKKHPILPNEDRLLMIKETGLVPNENVFVRSTAKQAIIDLENRGVNINTLVVGDTQTDNPEMIEVLNYSFLQGIQVLATTRARVIGQEDMISSTFLHKMNLAKTKT